MKNLNRENHLTSGMIAASGYLLVSFSDALQKYVVDFEYSDGECVSAVSLYVRQKISNMPPIRKGPVLVETQGKALH